MNMSRSWFGTVRRSFFRGLGSPVARPRPATGYKVIAATRLLDEADIIEPFVRHTAHYADAHIFLDNGSTDGTLDVLRSLRDEGFSIVVFQNKSAVFREEQFNTLLYNEANKLGSSWTVFLDTDEFIDDRALDGGFAAQLKKTHEDPSLRAFRIALTDYRLTERDWAGELNVVKRMGHRRAVSQNTKVVVRGGVHGTTIGSGSHHVVFNGEHGGDIPLLEHITYAHFPERSSYQFMAKNARGRLKVLASAAAVRDTKQNHHYTGPFEYLRDRPDLFFHNPGFMNLHETYEDGLIRDPIDYKGGELRYTMEHYNSESMRAVRILTQYVQLLAEQHGALLDHSKEARKLVDGWSSRIERLL